jgi:hypothetical protein
MSNIRTLTTITDLFTGVAYAASTLEQHVKMPWSRRQSSVTYLDSPGAWDPRLQAAAPLDPRTIDVELMVKYDATITDFTAAWRAFMLGPGSGVQVRMTFVEATGVSWYADAKCISADMEAKTDFFSYCVIPASFFLASPFLYLPDGSQLADTGLTADASLTADGAANPTTTITSNSASLTFTNQGTLPDEGAKVLLQGPLTAPVTVQNYNAATINRALGTYRSFSYTLNILSGETITVDCATGDVLSSVYGAGAYQYFVSDNASASALPIGPGSNLIAVATGSASGQNGRLTVVFRPLSL